MASSYLLGGLLTGVGTGIKEASEETGKAMRERQHLMLVDRLNKESAALDREFRTGERKDTQVFTAGENQLTRAQQTNERESGQTFTAGQNQLTRDFSSSESAKSRAAVAGENALNRGHDVTIENLRSAIAEARAQNDQVRLKELKQIALDNDVALNIQEFNLEQTGQNFASDRARLDAEKERERLKQEGEAAFNRGSDALRADSRLPAMVTDLFTEFPQDEVAQVYAEIMQDAERAGRPTPPLNRDQLYDILRTRRDTGAGGAADAAARRVEEVSRLEVGQQELKNLRNPPPPPPRSSRASSGGSRQRLNRSLDSGEFSDAREVEGRIQVKKNGKWYWYEEVER